MNVADNETGGLQVEELRFAESGSAYKTWNTVGDAMTSHELQCLSRSLAFHLCRCKKLFICTRARPARMGLSWKRGSAVLYTCEGYM